MPTMIYEAGHPLGRQTKYIAQEHRRECRDAPLHKGSLATLDELYLVWRSVLYQVN